MHAAEDIEGLAAYQDEDAHRRNSEVLTEDAAALEFAGRYAGKLLYCHHRGAWHSWTGTHWRIEETGLAFEWARQLARELAGCEERRVKIAAAKTGFAAGVERFARSDRAFAVTSQAWDRDPWLLGTPEGTVDLKIGMLREPREEDRITKVTAVAPTPAPDCPRFLRFLDEATHSDAELIRFLRQWCGYSLTGITREHALVFVHGGGGEGKSTFINAIAGAMGDYAMVAAMDTFIASQGDRHPTDLAMLRGARLVTASETEDGRAWAESRIKQLTGGDPVTARFMRQDFFTFMPAFKLTIIGNHAPVLRNVDEAARRRFNIIPFVVKPARPDKELEAKLKVEWPGILRWMIEGCLDWQRNGLVRPDKVVSATEDYFSEQDLFGQWLAEKCTLDAANPHLFETSAELYASWHEYAIAAGDKPGGQKSFAGMLRRRGVVMHRTKHARTWRGIALARDSKADRYEDRDARF